jgi:membrane associated rhomboid family serine protease/Tfp pilus assembly protein PilF
MRSPPSPARLPAYPIAGGLSLMAIAVTVMTGVGRWPIERFEMGPTTFRTEPWRLLTSALPHLEVLHLTGDILGFWLFATLFEEVLGHARLLALIVLFAAGSAAAQYAVGVGGVGLSGVVYGLFAMAWVLSSRDRRFAGAVDARTVQVFGVWFVLCFVATHLKVTSIGNMAHASGALLGALAGAAMSARGRGYRVLAGAGIPAVLAASFAGATVLRPRVNLSHDGFASTQLGYQAIQAGHFDEAIGHYREAIAMNGEDPIAWYDLGIAYESSGRGDESVAAFRRSYEIDPKMTHHREAYLAAARQFAEEAQHKGDHERAIALLRPLIAVDANDTLTWLSLCLSYHALGRVGEEREAMDQLLRIAPDGGP